MDNTKKLISMQDVSKHNTEGDCWVVIHNKVYDLTSFLPEHPGGEAVILGYAGRDATPGFEPIHPPDIIKILPKSAYKGEIDPATVVPSNDEKSAKQASASEPQPTLFSSKLVQRSPQPYGGVKPPIEHMLNVFDLERVAQSFMKKEAWDYYSSGADDEVTLRENHNAFHRIWMKPRVMVNVASIDTSCSLLGSPSSFPVYITATALAKLGHPDGEVALTRAAHSENVIQMCPTLASCSLDEMIAARQPGQTQWFQLYVNQNRKVTAELVKRAEQGGMKGLFITVDAPQLGKREKDQRNKFSFSAPDVQQKIQQKVKRNQGTARAISAFIDPSLNWDDIKWFQSITSMPIVLKGIQCGEDAIMAARMGIQGIVVSNHGGRQLDFSRSGIEVLPEVMAALRSIGAENKIEVYVDGGVRRGTDIFKALALGAKGVGIGRPVLYGLSAYGQEGVEKVIQILKDELEVCMRLMGTPTIADIRPEMVCTRSLSDHFAVVPKDYLSAHSYIPLSRL